MNILLNCLRTVLIAINFYKILFCFRQWERYIETVYRNRARVEHTRLIYITSVFEQSLVITQFLKSFFSLYKKKIRDFFKSYISLSLFLCVYIPLAKAYLLRTGGLMGLRKIFVMIIITTMFLSFTRQP